MQTILHVALNNFYASVECLYRPELRGKPVAVCGDPEKGINNTTLFNCQSNFYSGSIH